MAFPSFLIVAFLFLFSLCGASDLPPQWSRHVNTQGKPYYYNAHTKQTTWDKPNAVVPTRSYNSGQPAAAKPAHTGTKIYHPTPTTQDLSQPQNRQYPQSIDSGNREKEKLQQEIVFLKSKLTEVNVAKDSFRNSTQAKDKQIESLNEEVTTIYSDLTRIN